MEITSLSYRVKDKLVIEIFELKKKCVDFDLK